VTQKSDFQKFAKNPFQAEMFSRGISLIFMDQMKPPYKNLRKRSTLARVMASQTQKRVPPRSAHFWWEQFLVSKMHHAQSYPRRPFQ